jgi:hypothetical protein
MEIPVFLLRDVMMSLPRQLGSLAGSLGDKARARYAFALHAAVRWKERRYKVNRGRMPEALADLAPRIATDMLVCTQTAKQSRLD